MTELKLARLPDRTPVKIGITVSPDLNRVLHLYADLYHEAYGQAESVAELIPYMLRSFLDNDRGFAKARKVKELAGDVRAEANVVDRPGKRRRASTKEFASTES